jgi:hypothetical protein
MGGGLLEKDMEKLLAFFSLQHPCSRREAMGY